MILPTNTASASSALYIVGILCLYITRTTARSLTIMAHTAPGSQYAFLYAQILGLSPCFQYTFLLILEKTKLRYIFLSFVSSVLRASRLCSPSIRRKLSERNCPLRIPGPKAMQLSGSDASDQNARSKSERASKT